MYSDHNRNTAARRANDDFLRRMIGGSIGDSDGCRSKSCPFAANSRGTGRLSVDPPSCNMGDKSACADNCASAPKMPSLAMVYAPRQCWRGLLSPEEALAHGTQFTELVLPFYGPQCNGKEGCSKGCNDNRRNSLL